MGVQTFILDRRTVTLLVGGTRHSVGTLRRFFKLTELDGARAAELEEAALIRPSPTAVIVADANSKTLADHPDQEVSAHLVLGWEEGRGSVTDLSWDYLPVLGYAIRDKPGGDYALHEERHGILYPMAKSEAEQSGLLTRGGKLDERGQLRISQCKAVRPFMTGYAEADCILEDGREERLLIAVDTDELPSEAWLNGKQPRDVAHYSASSRPAAP